MNVLFYEHISKCPGATLLHEDRGFCNQDRRAVSKHFTFSTCTTELTWPISTKLDIRHFGIKDESSLFKSILYI